MPLDVVWFSCGATSAVACKLALQNNPATEICYIETGSHHPDNKRFLSECEEWFGKRINILRSSYKDVPDVLRRSRYINGPSGASCTKRLKVEVRQRFEYENDISSYIWGFEAGEKEKNRAKRMVERYPQYRHKFPLIERNLEKSDCLELLSRTGIDIPEMYKLGYGNNNCIGCVKGGKGYWNKIRTDFPDTFKEMAEIEREINATCINEIFLDELSPLDGRGQKTIIPACSIYCAFVDI